MPIVRDPRPRRYGIEVGDLVAGKYTIDRVLGEGGMGLVVAASQADLDRTVAIKFLPVESSQDPVRLERFVREARAAARLRGDHVAKVLDVGTLPSGAPFMVLEYLEGADLSDVLSIHGPLAVPLACDYVLQACAGVAEAHAAGIVHRDLKPENLFLTVRVGGVGFVKVLDFGLSKALTTGIRALTSSGEVIGSPAYMPPERLLGSLTVGPAADVWALGVVLYELVAGRLPFEAETLPDLCVLVANRPATPLREHAPHVSEALAEIVERCLEKDPARRFPDAGALAAAIEPFALPGPAPRMPAARAATRRSESLVVTVDSRATTTPALRGASRWRLLAGAAVVAAAAVALVVATSHADVTRRTLGATLGGTFAGAFTPPPAPSPATPTTPALAPAPSLASPRAPAGPLAYTPAPARPPALSSAPSHAPATTTAPAPAPTDDIPAFR